VAKRNIFDGNTALILMKEYRNGN